MRGKKRILPTEFDGSLTKSEISAPKPQYGGSECHAENDGCRDYGTVKGHDDTEAVLKADTAQLHYSNEPPPLKARKQEKKQELVSEGGGNNEGKNKGEKQESHVRQDGMSTLTSSDTGGTQMIETKGRKRKLEDLSKETTKSTKKRGIQGVNDEDGNEDGGSKLRKKGSRNEIKEESSFEQRRLKLIQSGGKIGKRKRSLSEGDLWQIKFGEETEEIDLSGKADAQKTTQGGNGDHLDQEQRASQKADMDTSLQSNLDKKKRSRKKKLRKIQEEEEALFLRVISK